MNRPGCRFNRLLSAAAALRSSRIINIKRNDDQQLARDFCPPEPLTAHAKMSLDLESFAETSIEVQQPKHVQD
jgi:hypothetical protein